MAPPHEARAAIASLSVSVCPTLLALSSFFASLRPDGGIWLIRRPPLQKARGGEDVSKYPTMDLVHLAKRTLKLNAQQVLHSLAVLERLRLSGALLRPGAYGPTYVGLPRDSQLDAKVVLPMARTARGGRRCVGNVGRTTSRSPRDTCGRRPRMGGDVGVSSTRPPWSPHPRLLQLRRQLRRSRLSLTLDTWSFPLVSSQTTVCRPGTDHPQAGSRATWLRPARAN